MEKDIILREGKPEDIPMVLSLIKELATYEKAKKEVTITEAELLADGFGEHPFYEIFVAEKNNEILGLAIFYTKYSTWKGRCIYLEDLVVKEKHRRKGIGKALFEAVMKVTHSRGYRRMEWQVLEWNEPAITFYDTYGAALDAEWINGRLTLENLNDLLAINS